MVLRRRMGRVPGGTLQPDARRHAEHPRGRRRCKALVQDGAGTGPVGPLSPPVEGVTVRRRCRGRARRSPTRSLLQRQWDRALALPEVARPPGLLFGWWGRGGGCTETPPLLPLKTFLASPWARRARRGRATVVARQKHGRRGGEHAEGRQQGQKSPSLPTARRRRVRGRRVRNSSQTEGRGRGEGRGPVGPRPEGKTGAGRWARR